MKQDLKTLREVLDRINIKRISANDLAKRAEFLLKTTTLNLIAKLNTKYGAQPL